MQFESITSQPANVTSCKRTPLGLEATVNENGKIFTVRTDHAEGKLTIVRGSTKGLPLPDELSPATLRTIRRALHELTEQA